MYGRVNVLYNMLIVAGEARVRTEFRCVKLGLRERRI